MNAEKLARRYREKLAAADFSEAKSMAKLKPAYSGDGAIQKPLSHHRHGKRCFVALLEGRRGVVDVLRAVPWA